MWYNGLGVPWTSDLPSLGTCDEGFFTNITNVDWKMDQIHKMWAIFGHFGPYLFMNQHQDT